MLLKKGKNEGFITYAELNENLPEGVIEADRLEEIVEMISDMGISVQEHANKASDNDDNTSDQETINPIENEIGKTTDPVRMYMREMGTIELLDREGEIENYVNCLLYTSPSPRDGLLSRMPSSA